MAPLLEVRELSLRLGGQPILERVSFTVEQGALVGLIGPNGAGKTSLLETVAGLLPASGGEVLWGGRCLAAGERAAAMFYLPDGIRPCPDHRASDLLELFRLANSQPAVLARDLVAALGLESVLPQRIHALSKGFSKRLLLALGLLTRAPLLLLDEPLDGLDVRQVRALQGLIEGLRRQRRTLLLSVHELALAQRLCESFLLLEEGRLLAAGGLGALREQAGLASGGLEDVFLALT